MKKAKKFTDFLLEARRERPVIGDEERSADRLKGERVDDFLVDLAEIMQLCPNIETIMVPVRSGGVSQAVNINREGKEWREWERPVEEDEALEQIAELFTRRAEYSESRGDMMTFRIWHFPLPGINRLEKVLVEFGGSGEIQDIDTLALIEFLSQNPELAEQAKSMNITTDSMDGRAFAAAMSRGDFGPLD